MTLKEKIDQLVEGILNEEERRILEDFVDNYVGTNYEGYLPKKEYYDLHKESLKPIWRKLKDNKRFGSLINILSPHINKGIMSLFT